MLLGYLALRPNAEMGKFRSCSRGPYNKQGTAAFENPQIEKGHPAHDPKSCSCRRSSLHTCCGAYCRSLNTYTSHLGSAIWWLKQTRKYFSSKKPPSKGKYNLGDSMPFHGATHFGTSCSTEKCILRNMKGIMLLMLVLKYPA